MDRKLLGGAGDAPRGRHLLGDVLHGHGGGDDLPGELDQGVALGTWEGPAPSGVNIRLEKRQSCSLTGLINPPAGLASRPLLATGLSCANTLKQRSPTGGLRTTGEVPKVGDRCSNGPAWGACPTEL